MNTPHITEPPLSPQAMADLLCTIMVICRGMDGKGKQFWAYMCIKPSMAKSFKEACEHGGFNLEHYGTIIECGTGAEPPAEVEERMMRDYGFNPQYEDDLLAAIKAVEEENVF